MTDKIYIKAQDLLEDSFRLAQHVRKDGFEPTFIVALWRGGAPIGLAIQEYFAYHGVETDHILVRTQSYAGIENQSDQVVIYGINYLVKNLSAEDRILIVDDVFDTGKTIDAIIEDMKRQLKLNMPEDLRVAVPYFKPDRNKTERLPDYYLHVTDDWLIYPHSIEGLTPEELQMHKPKIFTAIKDHL
ncbi:MAG: hypoxanthine phosphoribosyltransferase [Gammaproteobacteria bacterium TMED30]|nr:hypoxanthine phosphoribosyltransferase [Gammaproteobacteria bacterium]OUU06097.1 MAG: hypoxanthine phosphoribosyltransferase [Gammaproteobacteria bacterium TMED30]